MYRAGQGQDTRSGQGSSAATAERGLAISNIGPLPFPLEAKIDETGEVVTLLQTCDWPGHSPSNVGVDKRGKQFIASFDELTVTDHRVVPNENANEIRNRQPQRQSRDRA